MRKVLLALSFLGALLVGPGFVQPAFAAGGDGAGAVAGAALCRPGQKVEYVARNRRWPGQVEKDSGKACVVYTKYYMGAIDVAYGDLRPYAGAPEEGRPDVPAAAQPAFATTPKAVMELWRRDPEAAKRQFANTKVRLTGTADSVDDKSILFKVNLYESAAYCLFEPEDRAALRQVKQGELVTVEGFAGPRPPYSINIQQCRIVSRGPAPVVTAGPVRPPAGRYNCMNAGSGVGSLDLAAATYTVGGVTGAYRYDAASQRFTFLSGSYPKWGWTGAWRTDPAGPGGPPEPRIVLTDGKSLRISCYPQK